MMLIEDWMSFLTKIDPSRVEWGEIFAKRMTENPVLSMAVPKLDRYPSDPYLYARMEEFGKLIHDLVSTQGRYMQSSIKNPEMWTIKVKAIALLFTLKEYMGEIGSLTVKGDAVLDSPAMPPHLQFEDAMNGQMVRCGTCNDLRHLHRLFRCLYCGTWFCHAHAAEHFSPANLKIEKAGSFDFKVGTHVLIYGRIGIKNGTHGVIHKRSDFVSGRCLVRIKEPFEDITECELVQLLPIMNYHA